MGIFDAVDSILGTDLTGNKGTDAALRAQRDAMAQAGAISKEQYEQQRKDLSPWTNAGAEALSKMQNPDYMRDFTMDDYQADPGFALRMAEGQKAIERSAAARGGLNSGATLKSLTRFAQGTASDEYQKAYDRFNQNQNQRFGRLSNLAGMGQASATGQAAAAQNYGNTMAGMHQGMGNAQAAAEIGKSQMQNQLLAQGIQAGATALTFSDERLKENIRSVSADDIRELRKSIKPYLFKYRNSEHGQGEWLGVMAQDLEKTKLGKTLVHEDEQGRKMVDFGKALSLILATLGEAS